MEFVSGMVVISSAGHDDGGWFVVTGADGRYVYIADGKERRLASPKKKNIKHIRRTLNALSAQSIAEESE